MPRLALTGFLNLRFSETLPDTADARDRGHHVDRRMTFRAAQRLSEAAILMADEARTRDRQPDERDDQALSAPSSTSHRITSL